MEKLQLHNADCLQVLRQLPEKSIDLIATDPPYFRVKTNDWDNQWPSEAAFFRWLETIICECSRVLKNTGSIYLFASPQLAAKTEYLMAKYFAINNHIVWVKTSGIFKRQCKAGLRRFFPQTERIIFATHHETRKQHNQAYAQTCEPIIEYLRTALQSTDITQADINRQLGTSMAGHWFGRSQWRLPGQESYKKLQLLLGHSVLDKSHEQLRAWEKALVSNRQQPALRHFDVAQTDWYTDVWPCPPVQYYEGKHPCEKPMQIMAHIVQSSSKPGDFILDPFMGGGTTGQAAIQAGRKFIGCEMDHTYFLSAKNRINQVLTPV